MTPSSVPQNAAPNARTLINDPQYFGVYLNMARHNIFNVTNHLAEKFNLPVLPEEEDFIDPAKCFLLKPLDKDPNYIFSLLKNYIPVFRFFSWDELPEDEKQVTENFGIDLYKIPETLNAVFNDLEHFRNDYSHFYSKNFEGTENLHLLRSRQVCEGTKNFLTVHFERAQKVVQLRHSADGVYSNQDFDIIGGYDLIDKDGLVTEKGLVFLVCLFLTGEQANQFINRIRGFKNTSTSAFLATRETYRVLSLRLPADKFVSDRPEQALQLDILKHLNNCPKILYEVLRETDKKKFQPKLGLAEYQNILGNSINENADVDEADKRITEITSRRRGGDKFDYYAMQFLEKQPQFKALFQLNLGKLLINSYEKQIAGRKVDRQVTEELKIFGKLADFQVDREDEKKLSSIANAHYPKESKGFETYAPHYHAPNHKINIRIGENIAGLSTHLLPKIVLLECFAPQKASEIITDFLILNREKLITRDFIEKIKSKLSFENMYRFVFAEKFKKAELEKKYKDFVLELRNRKKTLNAILKEHGLNDQQVPTRILDYWLNISDTKRQKDFENKVKAERLDCKRRLRDVENGKAPKVGEMATYLAQDILRLVADKNVKQKATSIYYDTMQQALAYYTIESYKDTFIKLISNDLSLLNAQTGHPFLQKLNADKLRNTLDFYKAYLMEKGAKKDPIGGRDAHWLGRTFYIKERNEITGKPETKIRIDPQKPLPLIFKKYTENRNNLWDWLENMKNGKAVNEKSNPRGKIPELPVNIFDDAVREALSSQPGVTEEMSIPKMVDQLCHGKQPFYGYPREYKVYGEDVSIKTMEGSTFKNQYWDKCENAYRKLSAERKDENHQLKNRNLRTLPPIQKKDVELVFKKAIEGHEKGLRYEAFKDQVLFLLFKKSFPAELIELSLNHFDPDSTSSPLNRPIRLEEPVTFTLKGKTPPEISKTIFQDKRKLKDFGLFKKLLQDRRNA